MRYEKICPSVKDLLSGTGQTNISCPLPGCNKVLAQSGALHMHLAKVHKVIQSEQSLGLLNSTKTSRTEYQYHCPDPSCKYNINLGRYFKTPTALKQHYQKVHAEKKFKCPKCGLAYVKEVDQLRHFWRCDMTFMCSECLAQYKTKDSLYAHCLQSGHKYLFRDIPAIVTSQERGIDSGVKDADTDNSLSKVPAETYPKVTFVQGGASKSTTSVVRVIKRSSGAVAVVEKKCDSITTQGENSPLKGGMSKPENTASDCDTSAHVQCSEPIKSVVTEATLTEKCVNEAPKNGAVETRAPDRSMPSKQMQSLGCSGDTLQKASLFYEEAQAEFESSITVQYDSNTSSCLDSIQRNERGTPVTFHTSEEENRHDCELTMTPCDKIHCSHVTEIVDDSAEAAQIHVSEDTTEVTETGTAMMLANHNDRESGGSAQQGSLIMTERDSDYREMNAEENSKICGTTGEKGGLAIGHPKASIQGSVVETAPRDISNQSGTLALLPNVSGGLNTWNTNKTPHHSVILNNSSLSLGRYSKSLRQIAPKLPSPTFLIIPPNFGGNIVMNTSNYYITTENSNCRTILPKPLAVQMQHIKPCAEVGNAQIKPSDEVQTSETESQVDEFRPSISTQTSVCSGVPKSQNQTSTETQTSGDYILQKAMRSAKVPIVKESRASQVSPRAKFKRSYWDSNTSETQTQVSPKAHRKRRRKSFIGRDSGVNTDSPGKGVNAGPLGKGRCHDVAVQEIQTEAESVLPLPSVEDMARIVESISTQTADSYLATCTQVHGMDNTRDSEMQTRLHMDMTLDACSTVDMQSLQQLGLDMQQDMQTPVQPSLQHYSHTASDQSPPCLNYSPARPAHSPRISAGLPRGRRTKHASSAYPSPFACASAVSRSHRRLPMPYPSSVPSTIAPRKHVPTCTVSKDPPTYEEATVMTTKLKDPMFSPPASEMNNSDSQSSSMGLDHVPRNPEFPLTLPPEVHSTVDASTSDFDLPSFLSAEVQTVDFEGFYITNQTQTDMEDGLLSDVLTHMETQTTDDFWSDLGFSHTQTQTADASFETSETDGGVHAQTQTVGGHSQHSVQVQASIHHVGSQGTVVASADTETQTLFENLTDSHTQTSWKDLMKIVKELN